jgi:hypothetical protein
MAGHPPDPATLRVTSAGESADGKGTLVPHRGTGCAWVLSAMPERLSTERQVRSAIVLAEIYARNPAPDDTVWQLVAESRALAVGVTVPDAARIGGIAAETVARWSHDQAQGDSTGGL